MHFAGWATRCVMAVYVKGSSCYLPFKYFFRDCGFKSKTLLLLLQPKHPKNKWKVQLQVILQEHLQCLSSFSDIPCDLGPVLLSLILQEEGPPFPLLILLSSGMSSAEPTAVAHITHILHPLLWEQICCTYSRFTSSSSSSLPHTWPSLSDGHLFPCFRPTP